ncbi:MAG: HD domain-containing protein [Nitrosomonadales bacterium]|nr:HD domain-containing protein [Nitrosomonadales bacterium]
MELKDRRYNALYTYTKALSVALGYRDQMTRLHSDRVRDIAEAVGARCGLTERQLEALKIAATFHDIGKIGIPDHILLKPAQFDEYEWQKMKQHAEIGEKIIAATELEGAQQASTVIRHHHENYDGSGYPDGLAGEGIPICARIISIADSYDAMAVTRAYHRSRTHEEVMGIMQGETGRKYDPNIMDLFCDLIETSEFRATEPDALSTPGLSN